MVEPEYYMPIIPMGLVNGCEGIGSGWSTYIPNYNPRDIAKMIIERLNSDTPFAELHPWYKGYIGEINRK
jgi:DNA topoisomerase-2